MLAGEIDRGHPTGWNGLSYGSDLPILDKNLARREGLARNRVHGSTDQEKALGKSAWS
jgi:hypothetical protein